MLRSIAARALWLTKGAALFGGAVVTLALVLGVVTMAVAAVPGDPFKLGRTNTIDNLSTLAGSTTGTLLRINNKGSGPALDLRVGLGESPMNVNSTTKVNSLNADQLDDHGANDFFSEDKTYTTSDFEVGAGGGADVEAFAECDPGDRILGGGGGISAPGNDLLRVSEPFSGDGWRVISEDNDDDDGVFARAICADFPPLR
jgi:hypothetical protein